MHYQKNLLSTKEDINTGNEGQKINYNAYGKQIDNDKSFSMLIITLNVNGLNYPIKRQTSEKWRKHDPTICCQQETHFRSQTEIGWKGKDRKNIPLKS